MDITTVGLSRSDEHRAGVEVILVREAIKSLISYRAFNDRAMYAQIKALPFHIFMQVYLPTADARKEEGEAFCGAA